MNAIEVDNVIRGQVTSAAYGYRLGKPVCLGYIEGLQVAELAGLQAAVNIAGRQHTGRASLEPAF